MHKQLDVLHPGIQTIKQFLIDNKQEKIFNVDSISIEGIVDIPDLQTISINALLLELNACPVMHVYFTASTFKPIYNLLNKTAIAAAKKLKNKESIDQETSSFKELLKKLSDKLNDEKRLNPYVQVWYLNEESKQWPPLFIKLYLRDRDLTDRIFNLDNKDLETTVLNIFGVKMLWSCCQTNKTRWNVLRFWLHQSGLSIWEKCKIAAKFAKKLAVSAGTKIKNRFTRQTPSTPETPAQ